MLRIGIAHLSLHESRLAARRPDSAFSGSLNAAGAVTIHSPAGLCVVDALEGSQHRRFVVVLHAGPGGLSTEAIQGCADEPVSGERENVMARVYGQGVAWRTVWITSSRWHPSEKCAGENASRVSRNRVPLNLKSCGRCARPE